MGNKPKLLYASPFPPLKSGISDYSVALVKALEKEFDITLYTDNYEVTDEALKDFPKLKYWVDDIDFDSFDAQEILNSAKILYGDEKYAFISEFGFVTGVDRMMASPTESGSFPMKEVVAAQIFCHVSALQPIYNQKNGFEAMYEVGISEPLMVLTGP